MRADFPTHRNAGIINVDPLNLLNSGAICCTAEGVCNPDKILNVHGDGESREQMLYALRDPNLRITAHSCTLSPRPVVLDLPDAVNFEFSSSCWGDHQLYNYFCCFFMTVTLLLL